MSTINLSQITLDMALEDRDPLFPEPPERRSVWVINKRMGAIVGYRTPDGEVVRIANAAVLYSRALAENRHEEGKR